MTNLTNDNGDVHNIELDKLNEDLATMEIEETPKLEPSEPDAGSEAKAILSRRRKNMVKKTFGRLIVVTFILVALAATVFGAIGYTLWEKRVSGDEVLYGVCYVKLGEEPIEGKRKFIRPYSDILGVRFIDTSKMSEFLTFDNHAFGLIIVSMSGDDSIVTIMTSDMGSSVKVPIGEKYLFVYEGESQVVTHEDLCY